jgi:hypothetical protein
MCAGKLHDVLALHPAGEDLELEYYQPGAPHLGTEPTLVVAAVMQARACAASPLPLVSCPATTRSVQEHHT